MQTKKLQDSSTTLRMTKSDFLRNRQNLWFNEEIDLLEKTGECSADNQMFFIPSSLIFRERLLTCKPRCSAVLERFPPKSFI